MCSRYWSKVHCSPLRTHTGEGFFLEDCTSRRLHTGAGKTHEREVWAKLFTWTIAPSPTAVMFWGKMEEFGVWSEAEYGEKGKNFVVLMFLFDSFYSNLF